MTLLRRDPPTHRLPDTGAPDTGAPRPIGPLLTRLRLAKGWSQQRMAEQLCVVSGLPTVTRHEVSRWERQHRFPGNFWLGWLSKVLSCPVEQLETAVAAARRDSSGPATIDRLAGSATEQIRRDLLDLAHRWLVGPTDPEIGPATESTPVTTRLDNAACPGDAGLSQPGAVPLEPTDLAKLRRLDDLVGAVDLLPYRADRHNARPPALPPVSATGKRTLSLVAEAEQLNGWLAGDAGDSHSALSAYRRALTAAAGANDQPLAGHILGSASHLLVCTGEPRDALLLARTGYSGARRAAPAGLRALLLHRIALAAARCGQRQVAQAALTAAARAADRRVPDREPAWLYWLDDAEFAAMTGRCLAALRRPLRAVPLLVAAARRTGQHRTSAIYRTWLARSYLDLGELELACRVANAALLDVIRAGSARAAAELAAVGRRLTPHRDEPAVRRHATLLTAVRPFLPAPIVPGPLPDGAAPAPGGLIH